jgi:PAS domain S-box-containing protein
MSVHRISVLLVEDNPGDARLLREAVREAEGSQIQLSHADTLTGAFARLDQERFDVIMLDLSLPDAEGLDTLRRTHAHAPSVPIVVLTGHDDELLAVRAVREGAQDYLVKGQVTSQLLVRAMRYATERKRAIEALQRSEEYHRSLLENALDIVTVMDPDGGVRYSSPSYERVLGYEQGGLAGISFYSLLHPDDLERVQELLAVGSRSPGSTQSLECRVAHRNGSWRVFEAIWKHVGSDSSVAGFILNSRDITERKLAEEAVRHANETLRAVIQTSPLAIYSLDLGGHVQSWNSAAERIFGYSESDVLHRRLPIIFAENEEAFEQSLRGAAAGHLLVGDEQRRQRKDGTPVDVTVWNAQLSDVDGTVAGIVEAVADITESKRLEEQFRQAQKMEAVGRLAGGVAHDFNNLLTIITGYCQMILDRFDSKDPIADDMKQVIKAADRATALTKQLLAFSRKQVVQPRVVDLRSLIQDMQQMLKRLLGENIELAYSAAPDLGRVRVDPGQLGQVIVNMVVNARDAMPNGGTVRIDIRNVQISSSGHHGVQPGSYVLLEVSDTGTGMDEQTRLHLFEPFFTTKEKGRGTGLGLSTSYGIVKQNHGEIIVESEPGLGSTFSVYLPSVDEPADTPITETSKASVRSHALGTETILVAEDEEDVRTVINEMLRKQGYRVLTASGGHQALELARKLEGRLHLLISDIMMPGMGGRELAEHVRRSRPGLKVLYVSGYTDGAIANEEELEPETDFLHKPFTPDQLAAKVRQVLEGRPAIA